MLRHALGMAWHELIVAEWHMLPLCFLWLACMVNELPVVQEELMAVSSCKESSWYVTMTPGRGCPAMVRQQLLAGQCVSMHPAGRSTLMH